MQVIHSEIYRPSGEWQFSPTAKVNFLQLTPEPDRQPLSDQVINLADDLTRGERFPICIHIPPIPFAAKILNYFSKIKRQPNRFAVGLNIFGRVEFGSVRHVGRDT